MTAIRLILLLFPLLGNLKGFVMSKLKDKVIEVQELIEEGLEFDWIALVTATSIEFVNEVANQMAQTEAYVFDNDYID